VIAANLDWSQAFRLIAARLPRLDIFERVSAPGDLPAILELEALTNPRLRPVAGLLAALAPEDRLFGPGASFVMAAFAYPRAARFSDERAGAYYAGESLATSVAEVSFHRARFAARTPTPPMDFDERIVEARIAGRFSDIRGLPPNDPLYDPDPERYGAPQAFAAKERSDGAGGIVYRSVRRPGGECIAVFQPRLIRDAHTSGYLGLRWDGTAIVDAYRKDLLVRDYG
jgi:hypothetical protein